MDIFSARLKWLRENKNLTQADMANLLGISRPGYTKIENGQREPNLNTLAQLPEILDESTDFMLGVTDFDKHGEFLMTQYETAYMNVVIAEQELISLQINPHADNIRSSVFDPNDPEDIMRQIEKIEKYLSGWRLRRDQTLPRLEKYMNQIPMVSESYFSRRARLIDYESLIESGSDVFNSNTKRTF